VQRALDLVQQMHTETLPQCLASIYAVVAQTGLKRPTALAKTTDFFKNSVTKLAPDGSIRFFVDIGQEAQFSVNTATEAASIRFAATATEDTQGGDNYKNAEVRAVFGGARQVRIRLTGPSWAASAI
jgi:hypothetical protein